MAVEAAVRAATRSLQLEHTHADTIAYKRVSERKRKDWLRCLPLTAQCASGSLLSALLLLLLTAANESSAALDPKLLVPKPPKLLVPYLLSSDQQERSAVDNEQKW